MKLSSQKKFTEPAFGFFQGGNLAKSIQIKPQNMSRIQKLFADSDEESKIDQSLKKLDKMIPDKSMAPGFNAP